MLIFLIEPVFAGPFPDHGPYGSDGRQWIEPRRDSIKEEVEDEDGSQHDV